MSKKSASRSSVKTFAARYIDGVFIPSEFAALQQALQDGFFSLDQWQEMQDLHAANANPDEKQEVIEESETTTVIRPMENGSTIWDEVANLINPLFHNMPDAYLLASKPSKDNLVSCIYSRVSHWNDRIYRTLYYIVLIEVNGLLYPAARSLDTTYEIARRETDRKPWKVSVEMLAKIPARILAALENPPEMRDLTTTRNLALADALLISSKSKKKK